MSQFSVENHRIKSIFPNSKFQYYKTHFEESIPDIQKDEEPKKPISYFVCETATDESINNQSFPNQQWVVGNINLSPFSESDEYSKIHVIVKPTNEVQISRMSNERRNRVDNISEDRFNRNKTLKGIVQRIKKTVSRHAAQALKSRHSKLREVEKLLLRKKVNPKTVSSDSDKTQK